MNSLLKIGAAMTLAATTFSFTAQAADIESKWTLGENNGTAFLYMADATGPSLTLNCSDRMGIQAVVYLNGNSIDDLGVSTQSRLRTRNIEIDSDTTDPRGGDWLYLRPAKTLISTRGWQGKRLYNAAVSGSPVTMEIARLGTYNITPPAVNDDFREFVSSCAGV